MGGADHPTTRKKRTQTVAWAALLVFVALLQLLVYHMHSVRHRVGSFGRSARERERVVLPRGGDDDGDGWALVGGDGRASSAGGGHGVGARGSVGGGSRAARGMTAAEAEISRLRACVKEAEGKLVEERLMFSAILEEERENARRLRERARRESESGVGKGRPPVIHTSKGALLDRRYLAGMMSAADGGAANGVGHHSPTSPIDLDGVEVDVGAKQQSDST